MKAVVFAYNNIGCEGIEALLKNGFEISAVFTHKDDPAENLWFRSVAELAAEKGIPVYAPENPNHPLWRARIQAMKPDYLFSFYYRSVLKKEILEIPSKGALNLHGSLLPKYRGCAPLNWAVINGEKESGVTLHLMTEKVDAGDIVAQKKFAISGNDTAKDVHLKAVKAAAELLAKELPALAKLKGKVKGKKQSEKDATCFPRRKPADGAIDWTKSAAEVRNLVRGVTRPFPGAFSYLGDKKYLIWEVSEVKLPAKGAKAKPGVILSTAPLTVACGRNAVRINFAQVENGLYASGEQLVRDCRLVEKMQFVSDPAALRPKRKKSILILGVNGFIGSAISERLLASGEYEIYGMDLRSNYIQELLDNKDFHFTEGDITIHREWIEYYVKKCDVVLQGRLQREILNEELYEY